ncbi:hypothetical protein P0082_00340 [Candidatus Haliotispira prima]|uniref:DUF4249 family protein n=1 Tax=Candidatus Haliotispira prima TaxID=3034016 RepID=A0ABY8MKK3_9SPIO|nr:hypothetical protein P0082_00340 [Candidatus Haliotispira prima]
MLACTPLSDTKNPDTGDPAPPAAASLNVSMAWVSMREGLVQWDNGTQGVKIIGVVVSRADIAPSYAEVKDLPGFYTRKTKADGTPRTVYLSMTDKMTVTKFSVGNFVSVDGGAAGFVSAIAAAPELLHPNTDYYAHFYEVTATTGTAIEKLKFTTENFPGSYPTSRGTYSSFYAQIAAGSTSPAMEYKNTENYLIPARYYYFITGGGPYIFTLGFEPPTEFTEISGKMRPLSRSNDPELLFYDLYRITPSGPGENAILWDGMIKISILNLETVSIDAVLGGEEFLFYRNKKMVSVTE